MSETNFLRPHQISRIESDVRAGKAALNDPTARLEDRSLVTKRVARLEKQLAEETPPDITREQENRLAKIEKDLRTQIASDGMPSHEEMRRAPDGAVGKHMRWEKRNKKALLRWKNVMLTLSKGSSDPDIANFERHRPHDSTIGMHSAQIGKDQDAYSFPSEQFKANYDNINWSAIRNGEQEGLELSEPPVDRAEQFVSALDDLGALTELLDEERRAQEIDANAGDAELPSSLGE